MENPTKKKRSRYFTRHAKSSAMFVSLAIHALILILAISFVAVKVIQKTENSFKPLQIARPKMPPKKLQVPVKTKRRTPPPRLRKQITAKQVVKKMPEIKMPEIKGVKSNIGAMGTAIGGESGIGFSMPEINVFGIKSRGEKVFFILDSSNDMMRDEVGGMRAFRIIKEELVAILHTLPPTTLFNVAICEIPYNSKVYFQNMVPASQENISKIERWIAPLNEVPEGTSFLNKKDSKRFFGLGTLAEGGSQIPEDSTAIRGKTPKAEGGFFRPLFLAMQEEADNIFLLTSSWGYHMHVTKEGVEDPALKEKWRKNLKIAQKRIKEENKKRIEKGLDPLPIRGTDLFGHYKDLYVDTYKVHPEQELWSYNILSKELKKSWGTATKNSRKELGLRKKKKNPFSVNIIHFVSKDGEKEKIKLRLKGLANSCHGQYRSIPGLEAIQAAAITKSVSKSEEPQNTTP